MVKYRKQILVCSGAGCDSRHSEEILDNLKLELEALALENDIQVIKTGCFGLCGLGPVVKIMPDDIIYTKVTPEDAVEIISEHIVKGKKIERLVYKDPLTQKLVSASSEMASFKKQLRIVLRNCGIIDPESIGEAIARDAYLALGKVLKEMKPVDVIKLIQDSGLRGRGGAGFPTGLKWKLAFERTGGYLL